VEEILDLRSIELSDIPYSYNPKGPPSFRLQENTLPIFIEAHDLEHKNYLTKAHFFSAKVLAAPYPSGVQFLFVERDLRDAIVSHYHHFSIYYKIKLSFSLYYWLIGRFKAYEIWLFNARARKYFQDAKFFQYADMKANPREAMQRICSLLGLRRLSDAEIEEVICRTSIDQMRNQAAQGDRRFYHGAGEGNNAKLFRRGKVGEYKQYFGDAELSDINRIAQGKISWLSRTIYTLTFTLRRKLGFR
jgi:hypothetical protein